MYSPELSSKIAVWRAKAADGTLSLDEMREAIRLMRQGRMTAVNASQKAKKTSGPAKSADDLLSEISAL